MKRRPILLMVLCCGLLAFLAGPPPRLHAANSAIPMSAFDAGRHLQDLHHSGKQHRFGQRRASETVPPPIVLPGLLWVEAPDATQASGDSVFRPLRAGRLFALTSRAPPPVAV